MTYIYIYIYIYIYGGIVKFHMHWESIGNSENDNHCLNFKSNYDKMKITSIKVNLIKYFFMRNWVLKTLYSRGFTSIEVVFHCNGCIAFSGKFFSGGTSKEVRPLERGDSPRMSRRLRPVIETQIKETPKIRITGLCAVNSPVTGEFPAQRASSAENVSIWWRHHCSNILTLIFFKYLSKITGPYLSNDP